MSMIPLTLDWSLPINLSWVYGMAFWPRETLPGVYKVHPQRASPTAPRYTPLPLLGNRLDLRGNALLKNNCINSLVIIATIELRKTLDSFL